MIIVKINLKSQSAMEFIVLASFMLLVMLGFFAVTSSNVLEAKEEGNRKIAEDIADFAYREIETAKSVNDGYTRVFAMPRRVNGVNYSVSITDNRELIVNYLGYEHVKFLPPNVTGNISKGLNKIKKINDIVYINSISGECSNGIDDDNDALTDTEDPDCYLSCNYLNPDNYVQDANEAGSCSCSNVAKCCAIGFGTHYSLFDSSCIAAQCWSACLPLPILTFKNNIQNIIRFYENGSVVLRGSLSQNTNPAATSDNEFIFKDRNGNAVAVVNLVTGNMIIKGSLQENQQALTPSASSNDFIVKANGNVISYVDESGNFLLKGTLTQNGNP